MSSVNQCIFIGNLGADPEIRTMSNGDKVANIRIAVTEKWKDRNTGEKKEKTEWVPIVIWGALVNVVESYLKKGSKVFVQGKFQTRKYQAQDGTDRYSTEVVMQGGHGTLVMLDSAGGSGGGGGYDSGSSGSGGSGTTVGSGVADDDSDSIPF